jgi:hypothetical protein
MNVLETIRAALDDTDAPGSWGWLGIVVPLADMRALLAVVDAAAGYQNTCHLPRRPTSECSEHCSGYGICAALSGLEQEAAE